MIAYSFCLKTSDVGNKNWFLTDIEINKKDYKSSNFIQINKIVVIIVY